MAKNDSKADSVELNVNVCLTAEEIDLVDNYIKDLDGDVTREDFLCGLIESSLKSIGSIRQL